MARSYIRFLDWILDFFMEPQMTGPLPPPPAIKGRTGPRSFY